MSAHRLLGAALTVVLVMALGAVGTGHLGGPDRVRAAPALVVWTPEALPDGFSSAVADLDPVTAASVVRAGTVGLVASWDRDGEPVDRAPEGLAIPLDALAVDPRAHADVLDPADRGPFRDLGRGQALLGTRSARLRGLGPGSTLELDTGQRVTVADVVDDDVVGSAEVVLAAPEPAVPVERYVVLRHAGDRSAADAAIRRAAGSAPVRIRSTDEVDGLRPGGSLLPQVGVKERFGEFAYHPGDGRSIVQDDAWIDASIRTARIPILGEVACHGDILPALEGAMTELAAAGLEHTVDASDYAGCYGPRLIRAGGPLSRHAWGVAVDLNATTNAYGHPPTQDPRLVETMARWGFAWGGTWLTPDGMHFEYVSASQDGR